MKFIVKWVLFALVIMLIAWLLPGISVSGFLAAMIVVAVIGLVNIFIRPFVEFISLPLNFLTLGLFSFVINALLFILVAKISPGFYVDGFWNAFIGAIILSVFTPLIENIKFEED